MFSTWDNRYGNFAAISLLMAIILSACGSTDGTSPTPTEPVAVEATVAVFHPTLIPQDETPTPMPTTQPLPTVTLILEPTATPTPQVGEVRKSLKNGAEEMYSSSGEWVEMVEIGTIRSRDGKAEIFSAEGWVEYVKEGELRINDSTGKQEIYESGVWVEILDGDVKEFEGLPMRWSEEQGEWDRIIDTSDSLSLEDFPSEQAFIRSANNFDSESGLFRTMKGSMVRFEAFVAKVHFGPFKNQIPDTQVSILYEIHYYDFEGNTVKRFVPASMFNEGDVLAIEASPGLYLDIVEDLDTTYPAREKLRDAAIVIPEGSVVKVTITSQSNLLEMYGFKQGETRLASFIPYTEEDIDTFSRAGHMANNDGELLFVYGIRLPLPTEK